MVLDESLKQKIEEEKTENRRQHKKKGKERKGDMAVVGAKGTGAFGGPAGMKMEVLTYLNI